MKNIQMRVTALLAALMIFVSAVAVPASAESIPELKSGFVSDVISITYSMVKGDITPAQAAIAVDYIREEYKNDVNSEYYQIADNLYNTIIDIGDNVGNMSADVLNNLFEVIKQLGIDIGDFWDDYANEHGIQGESNVDMKGYGAICITQNAVDTCIYYGDYGVITYFDNYGGYNGYTLYGNGIFEFYSTSNGGLYYSDSYTNSQGCGYDSDNIVKIYGDWRTNDGEAYDGIDEITTEEPVIDDQDEETLKQFLNDLLEQLSIEFPDLSTVEGLLRAILNQCIQINTKMDEQNGVVDSEELQLMLEMSIASLMTNNDENNTALLNELIGIREDMAKYFGTDSIVDTDEEDVTEEDVKDDSFIEEIIKKLTDCISLFHVSLVDLPTLDDVRDLGEDGIQLLLKTVDLFVSVAEVLPLLYINNILQIMEGMMFDKSTPADLTFTIDFYGESVHLTLLSAETLAQDGYADAIYIVRTLTGFLMVYVWLKWCRRYIISIVG